jgi:hypothetical protein
MGLVNRSPLLGRYDLMCTRAWEIGDAMVCAHEGQASLLQVKHNAKMELNGLRKERQDLERLMERQKLLTKALEDKLAPPAKVATAAPTE